MSTLKDLIEEKWKFIRDTKKETLTEEQYKSMTDEYKPQIEKGLEQDGDLLSVITELSEGLNNAELYKVIAVAVDMYEAGEVSAEQKVIVLEQKEIFRDGGTRDFLANDGKDYWQDNAIGSKDKGRIYEGKPFDKTNLARGKFRVDHTTITQ